MGSWQDIDGKRAAKAEADAKAAEEARIFHALCARVLGTPDGLRLLATLRRAVKDITHGPDASKGALMWHDGRRHLLSQLETWTANGLNEPPSDLRNRLEAVPGAGVGSAGEPARPAPPRRGVRGLLARWFRR